MYKLLTIIICLTALYGCVTAPSEKDIQNANYGPMPANYKQQIKSYFDRSLKDPDTAKIKLSAPEKLWFTDDSSLKKVTKYGWVVCAGVNAKNSYGAYTGYEDHTFYFEHGELLLHSPFAMNSGRVMHCNY